MKKFKLILINTLIFITILFVIEGIIWINENEALRKLGGLDKNNQYYAFHPGIKKFYLDLNSFPKINKGYEYGRQPVGLEYNKKPIVIFGCSYAYGQGLNSNQTLSYKLSHQAKVPAYSRSHSGWGIQHMLYQVEKPLFYEKVPEPSHAIYVYIPDHMNRLYFHSFILFDTLIEKFNLRYKEKNGELQEVKHDNFLFNQIQRLYIINKINQYIVINTPKGSKQYDFALKHFIVAKEKMQEQWKNTKYVVIFYTAKKEDVYLKKKLEENDFIILDADEMANKNLRDNEYMSRDYHPTEEAWNLITPKIIEYLNLK
ncbi:MAG: hypothetical protein IJY61_00055 [Candidatus Gastranaerophilales bacterium]|nr:hypothetical protein [Candidatus Gastranaerophilales bacterium]